MGAGPWGPAGLAVVAAVLALTVAYGLRLFAETFLGPPWARGRFATAAVLGVTGFLAREVITPRSATRPAIVAVPIQAPGELEVAVLANMVTLTPGTLTLDVGDDGDVLYVHATHLDAVDELRLHVQAMEQRLLEVL